MSDASRSAGDAGQMSEVGRGNVRKDLLPRVISGLVYAVVMIAGVLAGEISTIVLVSALSGMCCFEFIRMMRSDAKSPNTLIAVATAVCYPVVASIGGRALVVSLTVTVIAALLIWYVFSPRVNITDISITMFGALYCGLMLSCLVAIRSGIDGLQGGILAFGVILGVWANDSVAYLVGSRFGRHKMAPKISPRKSWEGFYAGLAASIVVWCLVPVFVPALGWPWAALCGLVCGIMGVLGDFVESRIKRGAGVKDSGRIMPGHGGMLDRCDSLIFVSFFAYVLLTLARVI